MNYIHSDRLPDKEEIRQKVKEQREKYEKMLIYLGVWLLALEEFKHHQTVTARIVKRAKEILPKISINLINDQFTPKFAIWGIGLATNDSGYIYVDEWTPAHFIEKTKIELDRIEKGLKALEDSEKQIEKLEAAAKEILQLKSKIKSLASEAEKDGHYLVAEAYQDIFRTNLY